MQLVGLQEELARLTALRDRLPERGGALLIRGPRGHGRSSLLAQVRPDVRITGSPLERGMPFSGLHQLLRPLGAFAPPLTPFSVLERLTAAGPLVIAIDDAHWLDPQSLDALAFVARRCASLPLVLVATAETAVIEIDELVLGPLRDGDAAQLLPNDLPEPLRGRVLAEARGMPLAVVELGRAAADASADLLTLPGSAIPVTPRLAEVLQAQVERCTSAARSALLAAALDPDARLEEILALSGATVADLGEPLAAGIVTVEGGRVRFPRPLSRTAFVATLGPRRVQATHLAFADLLGPGERQVRHRAAAAIDPDAELAHALAKTVSGLRRRGSVVEAARTLEAAADLTPDPAERAERLVRAAALALELGLPLAVRRLLDRAQQLGAPDHVQPLIELLGGEWPPPDDAESARLISALVGSPDPDAALSGLMPLAMSCWWSDTSPRVRALLQASVNHSDDTRALAITALADPAQARERVLARLGTPDEDPLHLAIAAEAIGAWHEAQQLLGPAVAQLRRHGQGGALAQALAHQAWASLQAGDWPTALAAGREARELALHAGRQGLALAGELVAARAAALIAPREEAEALIAGVVPHGLAGAEALLRAARASLASADGDFGRVHEELATLLLEEPHATLRAGGELFDFVEACCALRRRPEAEVALSRFSERALGSLAAAAIGCGRALLEDRPPQTDWPFLRARTLLALGGRRHRRREPGATGLLRIAREEQSLLGARHFVDRAERELRATGSTRVDVSGALTPHELRIARLAAGGLTNAEIADRLRVSSRTVGSHMYAIFPKLGITSRTQLAEALE